MVLRVLEILLTQAPHAFHLESDKLLAAFSRGLVRSVAVCGQDKGKTVDAPKPYDGKNKTRTGAAAQGSTDSGSSVSGPRV